MEAAAFLSLSEICPLIAGNFLSQLMFAAVCCHLAAGWKVIVGAFPQSTAPEIATKQLNQNEVLLFYSPAAAARCAVVLHLFLF